jgi:hypothetical protein
MWSVKLDGVVRPGRRRPGNGWLVLVGLVLAVVVVVLVYQASIPGRADVRAAADATAYELERTPVKGLGVYIFDVQRALAEATRGSRGFGPRLKVTDAGRDDRGDLYEITNSDGDYPVCLAVKVDVDLTSSTPTFPTTAVSDGPCRPH